MRMWMVDPKVMCRKHLLGEHVEMHMFLGSMLKGTSMKGYCDNNLMEPQQLKARHDALVVEMEARGYNHKSPMSQSDFSTGLFLMPITLQTVKIDPVPAAADLFGRCEECSVMYNLQEGAE